MIANHLRYHILEILVCLICKVSVPSKNDCKKSEELLTFF